MFNFLRLVMPRRRGKEDSDLTESEQIPAREVVFLVNSECWARDPKHLERLRGQRVEYRCGCPNCEPLLWCRECRRLGIQPPRRAIGKHAYADAGLCIPHGREASGAKPGNITQMLLRAARG